MYQWLEVQEAEDYAQLSILIDPHEYGVSEVAGWLQENVGTLVGGVLVEYPYIDKDYRSTFYHYYSKKGAIYSPHCVRLHFFKESWSLETTPVALISSKRDGKVNDDAVAEGYLGYMVLRPTRIQTIGRSLLSPGMIQGCKGKLIEHRHKCHVMGYRVHVTGFPFMQQHSDIAVCAHTACWTILRHYSERYSAYPEVLVHDVSLTGREFEPGGLLPSLGITARDAERIFAASGTYPLLVHGEGPARESDQDKDSDIRFFDEMLAYLESGFPLFGVQSGRGHAVAIVGFRSSQHVQSVAAKNKRRAWDYVSHLLVVDDNHQPYVAIERVGRGEPYFVDEFDGFIVPLPEKIFLPAKPVLDFATELLRQPPEQFERHAGRADLITRCFVTTTASWHRFLRQQAGQLPSEFVSAALELAMPQFIWVVEVATEVQRNNGEITARMILDATAGAHDFFPAFLVHDDKGALWLDRANRVPMKYQPFVEDVISLHEIGSNLSTYR